MYFVPPADDRLSTLRAVVENVLTIETIQSGRGATTFTGRLRHDAERAHAHLSERFLPLGYTPLLRRQGGVDHITAVEGVVPVSRSNWMINVLLFFATVASMLLVGGQLWGIFGGILFTLALLTILGLHEFGHYLLARIHGLNVTLPYFIPAPLPPSMGFITMGTFGAFIRLKSPVSNRKALFDMAIAGPLASFFTSLPLFALGLLVPLPLTPLRVRLPLGDSVLTNILTAILKPELGIYDLFRNPLTAAGWFGLLVTALNLLPAGQLDGGHIAYAALGRWARPLALITLLGLVVASQFFWGGWLFWAGILLFMGLRHPTPLNDITELDWGRKILAFLTLGLFLLIIALQPFGL